MKQIAVKWQTKQRSRDHWSSANLSLCSFHHSPMAIEQDREEKRNTGESTFVNRTSVSYDICVASICLDNKQWTYFYRSRNATNCDLTCFRSCFYSRANQSSSRSAFKSTRISEHARVLLNVFTIMTSLCPTVSANLDLHNNSKPAKRVNIIVLGRVSSPSRSCKIEYLRRCLHTLIENST